LGLFSLACMEDSGSSATDAGSREARALSQVRRRFPSAAQNGGQCRTRTCDLLLVSRKEAMPLHCWQLLLFPKNQSFVVFWSVSDCYPLRLITAQGPRYYPRYEIEGHGRRHGSKQIGLAEQVENENANHRHERCLGIYFRSYGGSITDPRYSAFHHVSEEATSSTLRTSIDATC